ncbi:MAG: methylenetetrahydrofolate--tRNA-(uracil(54)-C(5))-methyltransferase (FADH(2)-oxidizing) TrmFO [Nitrospirota bacterium]|nr:MAG: methylenetetrahydrofolate--tRNA-(uracil(54)-C(5))-methyltransferase (FADH(2)-oxidizing) TrmFO [Nitrospirota bacterium]
MMIHIIGGGLAGSEAAWQAAKRGVKVDLYEMRPLRSTEAHKTGKLGELVCSNSLRSDDPSSPSGVLKRELQMAGSLIMESARKHSLPAGGALAVDREKFAQFISDRIEEHENIRIVRGEVERIPEGVVVIATGPLTSETMVREIRGLINSEYLSFYDAIAPIISYDSIDLARVFWGSRYGKGGDDYINCPMNEDEYNLFYDELIAADTVHKRDFEDARMFEGCMPVEVMASRGRDTLRYGPLKPVGLVDPGSGKMPYAVVQLRAENIEKSSFNMVGFQCRIKWPEQKRVFRMIPGLENAEFLRYGSIHRNTFINAPLSVNKDMTFRSNRDVYVAGQLSGVEGYLESTAIGLLAGINAARKIKGQDQVDVPESSAHGALIRHLIESDPKRFQPSNINLGLFPPLGEKIRDKKKKRELVAERALKEWAVYIEKLKDRIELTGAVE